MLNMLQIFGIDKRYLFTS